MIGYESRTVYPSAYPPIPRCQEDDRQFLVKQIVALKQDNKRLVAEVASMAKDLQEVSLMAVTVR